MESIDLGKSAEHGSQAATLKQGAEIFAQRCGGCHTLDAAGCRTTGRTGFAGVESHTLGRRQRQAAHAPLRYSVSAISTFSRSVCAIASHFFSHLSSVFHEYRCLAL